MTSATRVSAQLRPCANSETAHAVTNAMKSRVMVSIRPAREVATNPSSRQSRRPSCAIDRRPPKASAVQHELLDAPVQQFGDVEHVFRGARHLVNPAELLQPFAGLAKHAQQL